MGPGTRLSRGLDRKGFIRWITIGGVLALGRFVGKAHAWILVAWAIAWSVTFLAVTIVKGEKFW